MAYRRAGGRERTPATRLPSTLHEWCRYVYMAQRRLAMHSAKLVVTIISSLIAGCATAPVVIPPGVVGVLTLCSAGVESQVAAALTAEVREDGGQITAGLISRLEGIFVNSSRLQSEEALQAYRDYLSCLGEYYPRIQEEYQKQQDCAVAAECEETTMAGVRACIDTVEDLADERGLSERGKNRYLRDCFQGLTEKIRTCRGVASSEDIRRHRAECAVIN